jgi:hypothetical protein
MGKGDWFTLVSSIIVLGAGALMASLGKSVMRIGGATVMAVGVAGLIFWFGYYRNVEAQPATVIQKNEGAPNFNVPGNQNQFNIYPPPQQRSESSDIIQAGILVGKAYGGRRLPNDATKFEFVEITNCAQLNTAQPFTYNGIRMRFVSEKNSAIIVVGRTDGPIRFGVLAQVLD